MTRPAVLAGGLTSAMVAWLLGERGLALFLVVATCSVVGLCPRPGLDPERFFSTDQRQTIYDDAKGICQGKKCWVKGGVKVHYESDCPVGGCDADYQADHVYPWSKGGRTVLSNGACLCRRCNSSKGARV